MMGNYNSENTKVLATIEQPGGNTRMLLFHEYESGRHEYVIGSYFHEIPFSRITFGDNPTSTNGLFEYEWDWGHYFSDIVSAVDYWKREVLSEVATIRRFDDGWAACPICGEDVYDTDLYCAHCGSHIHQA